MAASEAIEELGIYLLGAVKKRSYESEVRPRLSKLKTAVDQSLGRLEATLEAHQQSHAKELRAKDESHTKWLSYEKRLYQQVQSENSRLISDLNKERSDHEGTCTSRRGRVYSAPDVYNLPTRC